MADFEAFVGDFVNELTKIRPNRIIKYSNTWKM